MDFRWGRFFRYGYPADEAVLAITVGTWPYVGGPLSTVASVEAAVVAEAAASGYSLRLLRKWEYRLVTLLYHVSKKCD